MLGRQGKLYMVNLIDFQSAGLSFDITHMNMHVSAIFKRQNVES